MPSGVQPNLFGTPLWVQFTIRLVQISPKYVQLNCKLKGIITEIGH